MDRRDFFKHLMQSGMTVAALGLAGCGAERAGRGGAMRLALGGRSRVTLYDTYAMALYMDGGLGPRTGIIKVEYVLKNEELTLEFWHGHGGQNHMFTVTPEHFAQIKKLEKVTLETTEVAGHTHKLFIDFSSAQWRVEGAEPVEVPDSLLRI